MDNIFDHDKARPKPAATNGVTSLAVESRQRLLRQIYEYNTDSTTPAYLKICITGLTLEEGKLFEHGTGPITEDLEYPSPTNSPRPSSFLPLKVSFNMEASHLQIPEEQPADGDSETFKTTKEFKKEQKIIVRDLQLEKEILEMEGRRRVAKEQVDTRWEERSLKERRENEARIKYNIGRSVDVLDNTTTAGVERPNDGSGSGRWKRK